MKRRRSKRISLNKTAIEADDDVGVVRVSMVPIHPPSPSPSPSPPAPAPDACVVESEAAQETQVIEVDDGK